ncbi:polysaccharide deacetylase family protein [Ginsengibacter hankyongi]|uniref:Polysaccharide deacetylase family protein n=1 Tax=Ginsengibacter hankyongi TaxID=2607284 RepID=A0A5J5IAS8_9BACT|nr:polysaccharide deacetylase family protein [Ginsengibacter hankyongi]KAA9034520.1 polysaccharide deacetylase family protein [Ginsengibacter hankyongi]
MKTHGFSLITILFFIASCSNGTTQKETAKNEPAKDTTGPAQPGKIADVATILSKKEVPVLCYHHIREAKPGQSETLKSYSVSPESFAQQMKALKDSGYQTILPDDLYNYLTHGAKLPPKPVILSFDDTDEEQFSIGYPEMKKYGFKGVFFIMTISLNRPRYMTTEQLKQLSDDGNAVEAHTWDHHMVTKYKGADFEIQFVKPKKKVEDITGKPAEYFAYPYGVWNLAAVPELKKAGYKMAFILSTKRDSTEPLFTIRRLLVAGQWSTPGVLRAMKQTFHL